jgi:hypothetical protein
MIKNKNTAENFGGVGLYLRTKRIPSVPGPQWQEMVQPASVS